MERTDVTQILSGNIKAQLAERGMSMVELSRLAGVNDTAVFDILRQRTRSPKLETVQKIATALGVTVTELLSNNQRTAAERKILSAFALLSEDDRRRLLATAEAWASPSAGK